MSERRATVIGDGGWGTAAAVLLAENGRDVRLWGHDPAYLAEMADRRENARFLPDIRLPDELRFEADPAAALADADMAVVAVPTRYLRGVLDRFVGAGAFAATVVSLTKGIEAETFSRPSRIIAEAFAGARVAVLSGPSHAEEVARGLPAGVVAASEDGPAALAVQEAFHNEHFRVYTSTDVTGVELGGALKNVIAVAAGIVEGLGLGDNTRAALFTRGLAEITRLGVALGGRPETFSGLSGAGDLFTTVVSGFGRNRAVGLRLAAGENLEDILGSVGTVAEGVDTCAAVRDLARERGIDMPITEALASVLYDGLPPADAVRELMARAPRAEKRPGAPA